MLQQQLTSFFDNDREYVYTMIYGYIPDEIYDSIIDISIISIDSYGGENQGTEFYHIWQFSNADEIVYIKFYGSYYSHVGLEDYDYAIVNPVKKTIIVYE